MTLWNVRRSIVELIEAPTGGEAEAILTARIRRAGLEPYDGDNFDIFVTHHRRHTVDLRKS